MAIGPWIPKVIRWIGYAAYAAYELYDPAERHDVPDTFQVRRLQAVYSRTSASGVAEDMAVTTHHFMNFTDGQPDSTWTTADYQSIETPFIAMWESLKTRYTSRTKLQELRWYREGPKVLPPQPAIRVVTHGTQGTSTGSALPPQVAMTVTERTKARRHWGRFYLPAPSSACLSADGYIDNAVASSVRAAAQAMYEAAYAAENIPVVYSRQFSAAFAVQTIQVDDLFDVIRSRRYDKPLNRHRAGVAV